MDSNKGRNFDRKKKESPHLNSNLSKWTKFPSSLFKASVRCTILCKTYFCKSKKLPAGFVYSIDWNSGNLTVCTCCESCLLLPLSSLSKWCLKVIEPCFIAIETCFASRKKQSLSVLLSGLHVLERQWWCVFVPLRLSSKCWQFGFWTLTELLWIYSVKPRLITQIPQNPSWLTTEAIPPVVGAGNNQSGKG